MLPCGPLHLTASFPAGESSQASSPRLTEDHATTCPSSEEGSPDWVQESCTPGLGRGPQTAYDTRLYPLGWRHAYLSSSFHTGEEKACFSALQVNKRKVGLAVTRGYMSAVQKAIIRVTTCYVLTTWSDHMKLLFFFFFLLNTIE